MKTPGLGHNSYLLDCGAGLAVVIDPRREAHEYLRLARENNLSIAYILETHRQEDFGFGSATLREMTGAKVVSGCHELFGNTDIRLKDGEELEVGTTRALSRWRRQVTRRRASLLPDLIGMRVTVFLLIFVPLLVSALFILQRLAP